MTNWRTRVCGRSRWEPATRQTANCRERLRNLSTTCRGSIFAPLPRFLLPTRLSSIDRMRRAATSLGLGLASGRCWLGKRFLVVHSGRRAPRPTLESMIERGGFLVSQQPRNLRKRYAPLLNVLKREVSPQLIHDHRVSRALVGKSARECSRTKG
jgi:hypothetical protein